MVQFLEMLGDPWLGLDSGDRHGRASLDEREQEKGGSDSILVYVPTMVSDQRVRG